MGAVRALTVTDLRNINRESFLKFLLFYPWILGLAVRWLVPWMTERLAATFDLLPYYPLIAGFFGLLIIPALSGYVIGFLLLDERDDDTIRALQVTPLSMNRYLAYRTLAPILISFVSIFIVLPLMNLVHFSYVGLLPIAVIVALEGPIFALLLASIAKNKVQGLAVMKGMGILFLAPFVAWFVAMPWQLLVGIIPTYWPVKAFWQLLDGTSIWPYVAVGLAYHLLILSVLLRRFNREIYR